MNIFFASSGESIELIEACIYSVFFDCHSVFELSNMRRFRRMMSILTIEAKRIVILVLVVKDIKDFNQ